MSQLPVLIVGAGPTGLMMANELQRHGISFRIIDKNSEPTQGSNATWIQAHTLEIFDAIGMVDSFLKIGHKCHSINFYDKGKRIADMPLDHIDSAYPFILMLPQRETERLLNQKLEESKIYVERSSELINIKQEENGVVSTIKFHNGAAENITSDWVIACDGANSTIREKCQISFPGEDIQEQFMVADAKMDSFLPADEIHVFFDRGSIFPDKATIFSAFPWGAKQYRLSANLYNETPRKTFHVHEVKEVVSERTYGNLTVENVSWISPFWIHGKIVDNFQNKSIFLLGDAAHTHSPASGQGMNAGLQDAFNLAWKLALVIKQNAKKVILESFQSERHPIIRNAVRKANALTNMMVFDKKFFHKLHDFSKSLSNKEFSKQSAEELMQLDIHYDNSPIINYGKKIAGASPKQGMRAPNVNISDSKHLYHYLSANHTIFVFTGKEKNISEKFIQTIKNIKMRFSDIANLYLISSDNIEGIDVILDNDYHIHDKCHLENKAIYIIRPDTYIGYFSVEPNIQDIELFFKKFLINI